MKHRKRFYIIRNLWDMIWKIFPMLGFGSSRMVDFGFWFWLKSHGSVPDVAHLGRGRYLAAGALENVLRRRPQQHEPV